MKGLNAIVECFSDMQRISGTQCRAHGSAFCTEMQRSCSYHGAQPGRCLCRGRDWRLTPGELSYFVKSNNGECSGLTVKLVLSLIMFAVTS